jgi:HlyD family secretion protein
MDILVAVDESDIGLIQKGQKAKFTVQAYSDKEFVGTVKKIRLQPQKIANVVNYIVEAETANPNGLLMPGMTAEVDFIIAERTNVLVVPKTALNFQVDKAMLRRFHGRLSPSAEACLSANQSGDADENTGYIWYLNDQHELAAERVHTGVSDGTRVELLNPGHLAEGSRIITGTVETEKDKNERSGSKKLIGMPGPGGGGPGGGGGGPPPM